MEQITITKENKLQRNQKDFITAELDDELVLMHLATADYFGMDKTTTKIWKLLEHPKTIDALVTDLTGMYIVEQAKCEADIRPILVDMVARDFLQVVGSV